MAKRIYVSRDYEQPFHAVHQLIARGALSELPYRVLPDGAIFDGTYEYELSSRASSQQTATHRFGLDGASWFAPLRGQAAQNDDAVWVNFMVSVREEYHKRHSVLEYEREVPKGTADFRRLEQESAKLLLSFVERFFPHLDAREDDVHTLTGERVYEDIFGVSMRVELSAESTSGASLPLLCKLYFVRSGKIIKPISWQIAKQYDRDILSIVPDDDESGCKEDSSVIDETLVAFENFVKDPTVNFADYTWFGEIEMPTTDEEEQIANRQDRGSGEFTENELRQRSALRKLYVQMAHDKFELQCQRVDVLYISHIKIETFVCDLYHQGKPLMRAQMGINNALTIRCLSCDEEALLLDRDEIAYEVDGEHRSVVIDRRRDDLGVSDEQLEEILTHSALSLHLMGMSCRKDCARIRCASQLFEADGRRFCEDCHYPEVVYTDYSGKRYHTPSLLVATDLLTVAPAEQLQSGQLVKCKTCGRVFSAGELTRLGDCKGLCARAGGKDEKKQAARCYRRYRGMLSFGARLSGGAGRYCYEDNEALLFVVGRKKYIFNKLDTKERGYLARPKRIK